MPSDISLAQFNAIASGEYNAGQIDIRTGENGQAELVKVNNHVWKTAQNKVQLSTEHILKVKEAFISALAKGGVQAEQLREIRNRLGIPEELSTDISHDTLKTINKNRFRPLSRAEVRTILNQYANFGNGFTEASQAAVSYEERMAAIRTTNADAATIARRDAATPGNPLDYVADWDYKTTDAISLLSTQRPLSALNAARDRRVKGGNAVNERTMQKAELVTSFTGLVEQAIKMLSADVHESEEFRLCGETVKLVKNDDGTLSAILGKEPTATKVNLGKDAQTFLNHLLGRTMLDMKTLGGVAVKNILDKVYDKDLESVLTAADRTSLTRQFASLIIAQRSGNALNMDTIVKGHYNTGLLVEIANRTLEADGEAPVTIQDLNNLHEKLVTDNAGLDDDMKTMLMKVADIQLGKPYFESSEFLVQAPIVADIDDIVKTIPPAPPGFKVVPRDIGPDGVKDFVADLVFSDETMIADVVVNKPGESMRRFLSTDERIIAFAEIIRNANVLDTAAAPQITGALKEGFNKMIDILDEAFKAANNGKSIREAAQEPTFVGDFSLFLKNVEQLPGAELAKFDGIIQSMANKGCESLQSFINNVFQIDGANVNEHGALVSEPYKNKSAAEIKAELDSKSLNQILDSASNADAPGQVGFFKQVMSDYFLKLAKADKRSCFAAAMRYAQNFDFGNKEGAELESAKKAALNKFTGAILKGTSPLLQKMMQGLPKEVMGGFSDALADMKTNLAPIPRKVVQAHLMKMIEESHGKIKSIELLKSLGAASVGEAFLCRFTYLKRTQKMKQNSTENVQNGEPPVIPDLDENGQPQYEENWVDETLVVKIMRHDAEARVKREAEIFTAAAKTIPGMDKTWEGQLKQYMTEFDFTTEAANIEEGQKLYAIRKNKNHPLRSVAPHVDSMKLSNLVPPQKNVLVANVAVGDTIDSFFKEEVDQMRKAVSAVFEQDPSTKRIRWVDGSVIDPKTGKPKKVPVAKTSMPATAPTNIKTWVSSNYSRIQEAQDKIIQATKVWFHEALLGSGKFHGDAHSGNMMVSHNDITFIDFGNLYQLQKRDKLDAQGNVVIDPNTNQPMKIDERVELLRIIIGTTLRDKKFLLQGFENLLSPSGKQALAANRDKAEAILDSILAKGKFSYDIAYRLQAAVVELQKLGLELPPQINCFIQSMVRLQNTISEMNTILNQSKALLEATNAISQPPKERDELDIIGKLFDFECSPEGKEIVPNTTSSYGGLKKITRFQKYIVSNEIGGSSLKWSPMYAKGGEYYEKVSARLANAADPAAAAEKLTDMIHANADPEHNISDRAILKDLENALTTFKQAIASADTPVKKTAAIDAFCEMYCQHAVTQILANLQIGEMIAATTKINPPATFASAIMRTLFANSDAVDDMLNANFTNDDKSTIRSDVLSIATKELNVSKASLVSSGLGSFFGIGNGPDPEEIVMEAIIKDSMKMGGDQSYQIDIGV